MPKYSEMGFGSGKAEEEVPGVLAAAFAVEQLVSGAVQLGVGQKDPNEEV